MTVAGVTPVLGADVQSRRIACNGEGCVSSAWIDDGQGLSGDGTIAEIATEHQVRLSGGHLMRLGQGSNRQNHHAAVGNAI